MEIYKQYATLLLPRLKVFNASRDHNSLPPCLRLIFFILLESGKDVTDPGSYRLISLPQSDIKFVASVLAIRLNRVMMSIVHSDKAGFMLNKSASVNVR